MSPSNCYLFVRLNLSGLFSEILLVHFYFHIIFKLYSHFENAQFVFVNRPTHLKLVLDTQAEGETPAEIKILGWFML